ncbi:hypothetical protein ACSNOK_02180 [Streptomyces sp. URMC 126]|uniref:hypothetical protein n=1 Tax=Streptomyces sp. URMC 126 TaxID=3423401 RepID=UPI003F1D07B3
MPGVQRPSGTDDRPLPPGAGRAPADHLRPRADAHRPVDTLPAVDEDRVLAGVWTSDLALPIVWHRTDTPLPLRKR